MMNSPASTALIKQKARLRHNVLVQRDAFAADAVRAKEAAQTAAVQALSSLPLLLNAGIVAGYWPIRSELDPRPLMSMLAAQDVELALPVIMPDGLVFRRWQPGAPLVQAGFGTQGPLDEQPVVAPAVLLVPLVAFDRQGNRLGYGKGYYDATIARLAARWPLITIGLAFDVQEINKVPVEEHDRPLDAIVTQMQSIKIRLR